MVSDLNEYLEFQENMIKVIAVQVWPKVIKRRVRITKDRQYEGYEAVIEGIMLDKERGITYLCMVERKDGRGNLNSDSGTRCYRPRSSFEFIEEE